jgi:hypothetical protein
MWPKVWLHDWHICVLVSNSMWFICNENGCDLFCICDEVGKRLLFIMMRFTVVRGLFITSLATLLISGII